MTLVAHTLLERSLIVAAAGMERGFEGYVVPMRCTPEMLARRVRSEHVDPGASFVFEVDGAPAGILLVARRGRTSRIAALGFAPELRGYGHGARIMEQAIAAVRQRGDERLVLEVIAGNLPAIALYERLGFAASRRLVGFQRDPGPGGTRHARLTECDPAAAARLIAAFAAADLPWQLSASSLTGCVAPCQGFMIDDEAVAIVDASGAEVRLLSLAVHPARRRKGLGSALLAALHRQFDARGWIVPAIVPEGPCDEFFDQAGWRRSAISQFEMNLPLQGGLGRSTIS